MSFLDNIKKPNELKKLIPSYKDLAKLYKKYQKVFVSNQQANSRENGLEIHQLRLSGLATRCEHMASLIEKETDFTKIIDMPEKPQWQDPRFSRIFPSIFFF